EFVRQIRTEAPLIETYIQETPPPGSELQPNRDHYFLGRISFAPDPKYAAIVARSESRKGSHLIPFKNR
ncbi:MAG: hypothetical protein WBL61_08840, partial [Bryobacteraceae bacterium]